MTATQITSLALAAVLTMGSAHAQAHAQAQTSPTPPEQPVSGPGGRDYAHGRVATTRLGSGPDEVYLFEPADPTPSTAPVVVFCHGWAAMSPDYYGAWITHIVRRGYTVIYPRYQAGVRTPPREFTDNALSATRHALDTLRSTGHVAPDERGLAFVGHSMGGLIAANLAARAARGQLPTPLALMAVEPGKTWPAGSLAAAPLDDLSVLPERLLLVALAGDDDDFVRDIDARKIYLGATNVPPANKDYVRMFSDDHGAPALRADHRAPTAPAEMDGVDDGPQGESGPSESERGDRKVDALDYYGPWKLFDGLADAVFRGTHREYALGNTPQQRFMGTWSDRVPVRELLIGEP